MVLAETRARELGPGVGDESRPGGGAARGAGPRAGAARGAGGKGGWEEFIRNYREI